MIFYVTLPSDASSDTFPDSKASNYKVRLPNQLFLREDDWEVALSSISFPDSQAYIEPGAFGNFPMSMSVELKPREPPERNELENRDTFWVKASKIEEAHVPVKTGISFMKKMIQYLLSDFYNSLDEGQTWGDVDEHEGIPTFKWIKRGEDIDLEIDNSRTHTFSQHKLTYLPLDLVRWIQPKDGGGGEDEGYWVQGDSLQIRHVHLPTLPTPTAHPHRVYNRNRDGAGWWQVVKDVKLVRSRLKNTVLRLHSFCDWVISDINDNFAKMFGSPTRTLFVYTDVAQGQIVGSGMTDFIREVEYASKFGGRVQFEPLHLQFIPLRRNVIDVIEVEISETSGKIANFAGGTVILTLKFERRSLHR
ncbi:hypothetical protein OS493_018108 [Desmophyllum pertusum]|uniref:Uncharacterized protein n=1 Tax=Desmophyllum pertusum TaxID=174260 RepID=A0A9W9YNA3_9CNID|nr:hypothetical protein OS493_018108 [Desmophyllum pertusum]